MESPKKINLQSAIIAILVLLNVCTLAFFLLSPKPLPPWRCERRVEPGMAPTPMEKELGFSEEQRTKFAELQNTFGRTNDSLQRIMEKTNQELMDLARADKADDAAVRQKIAALTAAEAAEKWEAFAFGRALRNLCTADQRKKLEPLPPGPMIHMHGTPGMPPCPPQHGAPPPGGREGMEEHRL